MGKALFRVAETRDSWGGAAYLTHSANSLSLIGRHEIALKFSQKAMTAARTDPESPFPLGVYIGKARTLLIWAKTLRPKRWWRERCIRRNENYRISEAELLTLQAKLAAKETARQLLRVSFRRKEMRNEGGYGRALAEAESELAILLKKGGELEAAEAHLTRGIETMKRIGDGCNLPNG